MRLEVPKLKKCCFCLPIRHGLLIFGYMKLTAAVLGLMLVLLGLEIDQHIIPYMVAITVIVIVDIAFSILLVIACHKRNPKLITVYYYYGVCDVLVSILLVAVMTGAGIHFITSSDKKQFHVRGLFWLMSSGVTFINLVIQAYLVLLVRSEKIKLREALDPSEMGPGRRSSGIRQEDRENNKY